MQSNFNRSAGAGVSRNYFFGSSKNDIAIPNGMNVAQSHKFISRHGEHSSTIILFETKTPVSWNDARDLVPTQGTIVTMCKAPVPEMDGAMFRMMLNSLITSPKWVHIPGVQKSTFFKTSPTGVTTVAESPVPIPVGTVVHTAVPVVKAEKREREPSVEVDEYGVPIAKLPPILETQIERRAAEMTVAVPPQATDVDAWL